MIRLREEEFSDIVNYMREAYGINLDKKKVLIECRMTKLLEKRGLNSFGKYLDMLHQDRTGDMAAEMVNCLTTNYTYFYREPDLQAAAGTDPAEAYGTQAVWRTGYLERWLLHRRRMLYPGHGAGGMPPAK